MTGSEDMPMKPCLSSTARRLLAAVEGGILLIPLVFDPLTPCAS